MESEVLLRLGVPLLYLALLLFEVHYAARTYEPIKRWRWIGATFFVITIVVGALTPLLLPMSFLKIHQLLDLSGLGMKGVIPGVLTVTFLSYWIHRAEHRFDWLWRTTHQLHHSPVRVDLWGAFYTHPVGVMLKVSVNVFVTTYILGITPSAAATVVLITSSLSIFQHWNVNTPHWLGYLVPRPESHCLHHEREVHSRNFGDLPLWDMLFGTFQNPRTKFDGLVGFTPQVSMHIADMLLMRDVNK